MAQLTDTSAIQRLIRGTRVRIRTQWALEGATTATVAASVLALVSIFAVRTEAIAPASGIYLLSAAGLLIAIGALISASRRLDDEVVARRIDRASNLADRLSTAIAFERVLAGTKAADPDVTHDLMEAAIRDGVRSAPRANIRAAAPFSPPKDLRAALAFLAISAIVAGLAIPTADRTPQVFRADPDRGRPSSFTTITGKALMTSVAAPVGTVRASLGAPNVPVAETQPEHGYVPSDTAVTLGSTADAIQVTVLDWRATAIKVRIPDDAPVGPAALNVYIHNKLIGSVDFEVVSKKDPGLFDEKAVVLDPDEKAYVEAILAELKNIAQRDKVPELDEFAHKIEQLLDKAENGEITKDQLLDALAKAEDAMKKGEEPNQAEIDKQMAEMGKELAKSEMTKELAKALQKNDLQKAKEEIEKLAEKLDKKELSDKQKEELGKQLEKVAQQMEKQEQQQKDKTEQAQEKLQQEIRRLEKQKDEAKNDKQKQDAERRLEEKKRDLQKLQKEQEKKEQSEQRRAVKRLQKDLEKAAEGLQKPQKDPNQQNQNDKDQQEQGEKQASEKLKQAAEETGRVDKDQRKQAAQKKSSSQMDDLREAMRRAKQRGNKGPNDPFNKQGKNQDFISRARGQQGSKGAWKPGQGQGQGGQGQGQGQGGQGQGSGQNGGQGSGSGQGSGWGTGHDDNLAGDPTGKSGNTNDQELQGKQGNEGGSTRETILAAAQKGFASKRYEKVYQDYERVVEEVMRTEKLPSSYKYYVKRYFAKIHPNMAEPPAAGSSSAPVEIK